MLLAMLDIINRGFHVLLCYLFSFVPLFFLWDKQAAGPAWLWGWVTRYQRVIYGLGGSGIWKGKENGYLGWMDGTNCMYVYVTVYMVRSYTILWDPNPRASSLRKINNAGGSKAVEEDFGRMARSCIYGSGGPKAVEEDFGRTARSCIYGSDVHTLGGVFICHPILIGWLFSYTSLQNS